MSPILSKHNSAAMFLPGLFDKINAVYEKRHDSGLNSEQIRLVERIHLDFTRSGAAFDEATQKEYAELKAELATQQTAFQQNVMKDEEKERSQLRYSVTCTYKLQEGYYM